MTLAYIPGGTFSMGSPATEAGRHADEGPAHPVALPGFWMSVHEVTAEQYAPYRYAQFDGDAGPAGPGSFDVDAVTRPSPPYEDPARGMGSERRPATGVTRWNALHYARWLSEKTGRLYRLPTEAEWEYACRAGGGGAWGFGDDPARAPAYAWLEMNAGGATHPVGGKESNAWGLHDMHGNVAEWVLDGYDADAYGPRGGSPPAESPRVGHAWRGQGVVRGGAFDDGAADARCAERFPETPAWKRRDPQIPKSRWWNTDSPHVGFRLVSPDRAFTLDEIRAYFDEILGG
ncbi:MAG TPA: formylglycine-generating enzyme family protein [Longimicrobiales bacterium]|nr:formylglycine-generating enzyme family protein [Longimicrobiales bacterium]